MGDSSEKTDTEAAALVEADVDEAGLVEAMCEQLCVPRSSRTRTSKHLNR
jgi:hypothetical protein